MRNKNGKIALYNSANKINETKKAIIEILKDWDNTVFVFDFGHYYYDETINKKTDVYPHFLFKTVISGSQRYIDTLFPKGKDKNTTYKHFDRSIKEICNISDTVNNVDKEKEGGFELKIKEIVSSGIFETSEWARDLAKKEIGGCLLVSSIVAGNHQSAVWVVLQKPIKGLIRKKVYCHMPCSMCSKKRGKDCSNKKYEIDAINAIFSKIDELLINELVHNSEKRTNIEITHQSTRASISQAFVRNIAINLVPNVLKYLKEDKAFSGERVYRLVNKANAYKSDIKLPEITRIENELEPNIQNEALDKIQHIDWFQESGKTEKKSTIENTIRSLLNKECRKLFSYIANRCIYLNKAIDGVAYRVDDRKVYGRLFKDLDANRILLNHITGKDNFVYRIEFKHNGVLLNDEDDIYVSLPATDLGAHAFYVILENIIRNTAKHCDSEISGDVVFTVNFIDDEHFVLKKKYYRVEIWDNVPIKKKDKASLKEEIEEIKNENEMYHQYFKSKKTQGIKDAADLLVIKKNIQLNHFVIDTLRTKYLDLIEMEASAAFLRQVDLHEIESENYTLKHGQDYNYNKNDGNYYLYLLKAFKKNLGSNVGFSLGYRFYMKKPK